MKKYFTAAIIILSFITLSSSLAFPEKKPTKCPSVNALQNAHFSIAKRQNDEETWRIIDLVNNYDTENSWTFFMFDIIGESEQEVINFASKDVKNLLFSKGPIFYSEKKRWACIYLTTEGHYAASYTPIIPTSDT